MNDYNLKLDEEKVDFISLVLGGILLTGDCPDGKKPLVKEILTQINEEHKRRGNI